MDDLGRFRDVVDQRTSLQTGRPLTIRPKIWEDVAWCFGALFGCLSVSLLFLSPPTGAMAAPIFLTGMCFYAYAYNRRQRLRELELFKPAKQLEDNLL